MPVTLLNTNRSQNMRFKTNAETYASETSHKNHGKKCSKKLKNGNFN